LKGDLPQGTTATDLVLTCVEMLRKRGVVGKFVEFFGPGVRNLTLADRATIANMAPEYGATMGYFPIDERTVEYLRLTGREEGHVQMIEKYLREQGMFVTYDGTQPDPSYSGEVMELDLASVEGSLSGPKRPHDRVNFKDMKSDFNTCMTNKVGFKGFGLEEKDVKRSAKFTYEGKEYEFNNGTVVISAITSCTNTSNPDVMLAAGLLAKNAVEAGLMTKPYIKKSLSPGSHVVSEYYKLAGVDTYLDKLGFSTTGFGCMTCIGNSGEIPDAV
jgi:aconitate hydratase